MLQQNLSAANTLKISIQSISQAQAWKNLVWGTYGVIYPHIVADFVHIKDLKDWIDKTFAKHVHPGVESGPSKTQKPLPGSALQDDQARGLLVSGKPLDKVRKGTNTKILADIDKANTSKLT